MRPSTTQLWAGVHDGDAVSDSGPRSWQEGVGAQASRTYMEAKPAPWTLILPEAEGHSPAQAYIGGAVVLESQKG
jgi:hypothetical protein